MASKQKNIKRYLTVGALGMALFTSSCTNRFPEMDLLELTTLSNLNSTSNPSAALFITIGTTGLTTSENGKIASFQVLLNNPPASDVTLPSITSADTTEGTVLTSSLTFTPSNWNILQNVYVIGARDDLDAANVAYSINLGTATSADANWDGVDGGSVSITNLDSAPITLHRSITGTTYTSISGTGTGVGLSGADDTGIIGVPIGFSFTYQGAVYTTINISSNGMASFNTTGITDRFNENLFKSGGTFPVEVLAPWWDDLIIPGSRDVYIQILGSSPNREFIIEWKDATDFTTASNSCNFQIHLFETSNIIEFHYGSMTGTADMTASIGVNDSTGGTGHYVEGLTASTTTPLSTLNYNNFPASGQVLRFTPY